MYVWKGDGERWWDICDCYGDERTAHDIARSLDKQDGRHIYGYGPDAEHVTEVGVSVC